MSEESKGETPINSEAAPADNVTSSDSRVIREPSSTADLVSELWAEAQEEGSIGEEVDESFQEVTHSSGDLVEETSEEPIEEVAEEIAEEEAIDLSEIEAGEKSLVFKNADGTEVELSAETVITIPVDGIPTEVTMQEVLNGISGQKAISQKFTALDREKKAFEARLSQYNEGEKLVRGLMAEGKVTDAMTEIFSRAGYNPQLAFMNFFSEITPVLDKYAGMNPQQREHWRRELTSKRAEFETKAAREQVARLQAEQDQAKRVQNVQGTYGLDNASFMEAYHKLQQEMASGSLQQREITPELVGQYSVLMQREAWIGEALAGTSLAGNSKASDSVLASVNQLARQGHKITKEVVASLVTRAYSEVSGKKAKAVNQNLQKRGINPKPVKAKGKISAKPKIARDKANAGGKPVPWYVEAERRAAQGEDPFKLTGLEAKNAKPKY